MKRISLKGLADFMTASATKQRTIISQYKYPDEDEPQAKRLYYRETRDRIAAYHRGGHDQEWLHQESTYLRTLAEASEGHTRTRLRHNSAALRSYAQHFFGRRFEVLPEGRYRLTIGDVLVSVVPDLHVRESAREKFVKLEFSTDEPSETLVRIISQTMFEALVQENSGLSSASVLYLDVRRGTEHRGARLGSRMRREIESACQNISAIWESV